MKLSLTFLLSFLFCISNAQNPKLIGYWQNWNDASAPYIPLDQVDSRYNVICVAFAVPVSPSDMTMTFMPDGVSQSVLVSQIQTLRSQGKKVLLSIGGANAAISLSNDSSRDAFVNSMNTILNDYHFDGIDIDIEHGNSILASGTIANPASADVINLISAIGQIRAAYQSNFGTAMMLTFAPETAYVQGGMSAYGGIWGGYLPILDALRDNLSYIHVQLYNTGSVYGTDGNIYNQGTADFIVAMADAMISGFDTAGGHFNGFPANKIAVGLPACPSAGGGFTSTAVAASAMHYILGDGPQPGSYVLNQSGGYPDFGGMMTWSVNWDKVASCNASAYEFADNFESIFGTPLSDGSFTDDNSVLRIYPNPSTGKIRVNGFGAYQIVDVFGQIISSGELPISHVIDISQFPKGIYILKTTTLSARFVRG